jgi:hypothetical protein
MGTMKDFKLKDLDGFIEIADTVATPFKFVQVSESDVGRDYVQIEARVWLRTAYISWVQDVKVEEAEKIIDNLKRHGFKQAEIAETALTIR